MIPIHKTGKKVLNYCLISMKSQRLQWNMEPETINREKTTATFFSISAKVQAGKLIMDDTSKRPTDAPGYDLWQKADMEAAY